MRGQCEFDEELLTGKFQMKKPPSPEERKRRKNKFTVN